MSPSRLSPLASRPSELRRFLVARQPDDHKGIFGHVLIVAGSRNMRGAAILAARSALRSGAGLVTLAIPRSLQNSVAPAVAEALTLGLDENSSGALKASALNQIKASQRERSYSVMALGPGIGTHPDTAKFLLSLLKTLPFPAVIDADALNILASQNDAAVHKLLRTRPTPSVFTPHPGEMARILKISTSRVLKSRESAVKSLASVWRGAAILKGKNSLISDGTSVWSNPTGGPGLAKGGSGDVLTGLCAGLWAQMIASKRIPGNTALAAARLAAYLHGLAGDIAQAELGSRSMTAQNVIDALPRAFRRLAHGD